MPNNIIMCDAKGKSPFVKAGEVTLSENGRQLVLNVPPDLQEFELFVIKLHIITVATSSQIVCPSFNSPQTTDWVNIGNSVGNVIDSYIFGGMMSHNHLSTRPSVGHIVTYGLSSHALNIKYSYPVESVYCTAFYENAPFGAGSKMEFFVLKDIWGDVK